MLHVGDDGGGLTFICVFSESVFARKLVNSFRYLGKGEIYKGLVNKRITVYLNTKLTRKLTRGSLTVFNVTLIYRTPTRAREHGTYRYFSPL